MRITFLYPMPSLVGGCRVVAIYARGLALKGHKVTIVAYPHYKESFFSNCKRVIKGDSWEHHISNEDIIKNSHFNNLPGVNLNIIDSYRPYKNDDIPDGDIVIATWWETAESIIVFDKSKGKKFYFIQGYEVYPYLPAERVKATYRSALFKITIAQWIVDRLYQEFGEINKNIKIVSNSVDTNIFYSDKRSKQTIPTFSLIYSSTPCKGVDISLAAFKIAKQKYPLIKLIVFSNEKIANQFPLPDNAEFLLSPEQEQIRQIYSQSDAFLFSSREEGFGLPVLEAMACHCPVIATKAGCAPDFITDGENGELNDIDDVQAQAKSMIKIIEMDNMSWLKMSELAYNTVKGNSWDDSVSKFEKILNEKI